MRMEWPPGYPTAPEGGKPGARKAARDSIFSSLGRALR